MRRQRGFTLIEVMIATAILGILMAVASPAYLSYITQTKKNVLESNLEIAAGLVRNEISKRNAGSSAYLDTPDEFTAELNRGGKTSCYNPGTPAFAPAGTTPGTVVISKNTAVAPPVYHVTAYDRAGQPLSGNVIAIVLE